MQTKTFTLLVTVSDDGIAAVFNPVILAAAIKGALENGIKSFMLDSNEAARLGVKTGEHHIPPVVSAEVDAFPGDILSSSGSFETIHAQQMHRNCREG